MEFLVYRSRALLSPGSPEVGAIVEAALRNNARAGLTGFLHHEPDLFVQYLEGSGAALRGAWQRIRRDPRHEDAELIDGGTILHRFFGGSLLGYSDGAVARFSDFLDEAAGKSAPADATARETIWFLCGACQRQDLGLAV